MAAKSEVGKLENSENIAIGGNSGEIGVSSLSVLNVRDFCNNLTQSLSKELMKTDNGIGNGIGIERRQLSTLLDRPDFQALLHLHKLVSSHRTKNIRPVECDVSTVASEFLHNTSGEIEECAKTSISSRSSSNGRRGTVEIENMVEELKTLLANTHFRSLLAVHDRVARKEFEPTLPDVPYEVDEDEGCAVKIVRLIKNNEPLGATIKQPEGSSDLVIARIMRGGVADRSGCIQVGDRVVEVNGVNVMGQQPSDVVKLLSAGCSNATVVFKLIPGVASGSPHLGGTGWSYSESTVGSIPAIVSPEGRVRLRAFFEYNPTLDPLNPCPEAGIAFKPSDILTVVDSTDPFWWQAKLDTDPLGRVGLIPSKQLQEKRMACQQQQNKSSGSEKSSFSGSGGGGRRGSAAGRKVRRVMYETRSADDYERDELKTYDEVARLYPRPDLHRPVVLVGASGVGRNELKRRLILMAPDGFGTTVPHTSRLPKPGETAGIEYHFTTRSQMEQWAREGRFIEFGEYKGNLYGTTIDSVRSVVNMGKTCVLNPHPQAIRILYSPEVKPYIIYVRPPPFAALKSTRQANRARSTFDSTYSRGFTDEELERMLENAKRLELAYGSYFDYTLVNEHLETAFKELLDVMGKLDTQQQWVPISWVR